MKYSNVLLAALTVTVLSFTGCGGSGSSTPATGNGDNGNGGNGNGNGASLQTTKTAKAYFVTDDKIDGGDKIQVNSDACTGVDEAAIWKGKAGSNDALEVPTKTSGYSTTCTVKTITDHLPAEIAANMTLTSHKVWGIPGKVNVKSGVTLTIEPGTTIVGEIPKSYMIIEPGATINAKGTQAQPIVFTSKTDAECTSGDNKKGEWGGLILAGNAYTHYGVNKYEADESVTFGGSSHAHDTDSSGDLEYVLIKHSGFEVETDKELNGLSLAGIGSGTKIQNVAIIGGSDDGVEIWGGTVNLDHLYVYNAADDSTDTDLGYRGSLSNVLVRQVIVDKTNNHDSSAMEFGNDHNTITTDDSNATQPNVTNYTAYIKGGGFYNKDDAGFKWNNVKFISDKTTDQQLVHFRSSDAYTTGAKHITGAGVCFKDTAVTLTNDNTYSTKNSKTY